MSGVPSTKKRSTAKSGIGVLLIVVAVVIAIALAVYALTIPGVFETVAKAAIFIVAAIVVIALIAYGAILLMAVPMYIAKGDTIQEGVDYSLDDIKPVENSSSDDPKND